MRAHRKDVVSLHKLRTVPTATGQGIGTALAGHALDKARSRRAKIAVPTTSPSEYSVFQMLGFQDFGRTVEVYELQYSES